MQFMSWYYSSIHLCLLSLPIYFLVTSPCSGLFLDNSFLKKQQPRPPQKNLLYLDLNAVQTKTDHIPDLSPVTLPYSGLTFRSSYTSAEQGYKQR